MKSAQIFVLLLLAISAAPLCSQQQALPDAPLRQPDTTIRRFEVGGGLTYDTPACQGWCTSIGVGIGASIDLDRHFSLDANVNLAPGDPNSHSFFGGTESQYLLGVRAEVRAKHYGYFLKAQPGFVRTNDVITGQTSSTLPAPPWGPGVFTYGGYSNFASNLGGGLDYSPTPRIHLRTEVSDLVVRDGPRIWGNNLHAMAGIYVGLGKPLAWTPPVYDAAKSHRFFGRETQVLIMANLLAATADGITTQRSFSHTGGIEGDPLARPFVKYGWSGQIGGGVLEAAAEIAGMYGLHRMGHHRLERFIPVSISTVHAYFAYSNAQISNKRASTTP